MKKTKIESIEDQLKRLGIFDKTFPEVINEFDWLRAMKDQVKDLILSYKTEGTKSQMFREALGRLEVLIQIDELSHNSMKGS